MNIEIIDLKVSLGGKMVLDGINLHIQNGQLWGFHGKSGSGKTTLARALAKKIFFRGDIHIKWDHNILPKILLIEQQHRFKNKSNVDNFYYQQRFNSSDTEDTITVKEDIDLESTSEDEKLKWITFFNIEHILQEPLIQLSNGENKRLQLTKAMLKKPDLLILDNPFIGLDIAGREIVRNALNRLNENNVSMVLFSEPEDMPSCISHLAIIENGTLGYAGKKEQYTVQADSTNFKELDTTLLSELQQPETDTFNVDVRMKNVCISYDN
jgi:molybdate transport system ATP-binding protein